MNYLLALDTATATASVALYDLETDSLVAELTWLARRRHTQDLAITVQHLLQLAQIEMAQIQGLAVTTGPGSFTGVRIAISMAKGLSLGLPHQPWAVGVPTLCVTANPWLDAAGPTQIVACIQAGRGRFNWLLFPPIDPLWMPVATEHQTGTTAELVQALQRQPTPCWLVGETPPDLITALADLPQVTPIHPISATRRAGHLARLAVLHHAAGHSQSMEQIQPLYLSQP